VHVVVVVAVVVLNFYYCAYLLLCLPHKRTAFELAKLFTNMFTTQHDSLTTMFTTQQDSLRTRETAPQSLPRRGSAGASAVHRYQILKSPLHSR
jgi:hypothetical protein